MSAVIRALRGNPHFLNFVLLSGATLVPILYYVERRAPTSEQVENTLVRTPHSCVCVCARARARRVCLCASLRSCLRARSRARFCKCAGVRLTTRALLPRAHLAALLQIDKYGDTLKASRSNAQQVHAFWAGKRNAAEMDEVYSKLLRSGSGSMARHHHLEGQLARAQATESAEAA
ncbi:hypothetical protein EON66_09100, partial [archaeon]